MMSLAENLTRRYFLNHTLSDIDAHAKITHAVHQIDYAQKCFAAGDFTSCREACEEIVSLPEGGRSKAIRAKAYMLLARPKVEGLWWQRSSNAQHALECWELVIDRDCTAYSRFPIDQALEYRFEAEKMYKEAQRAGAKIAAASAERSRFFQATSSETPEGRFRLRVRASPRVVSRQRPTAGEQDVRIPLQDITNHGPNADLQPKVRDFALERIEEQQKED